MRLCKLDENYTVATQLSPKFQRFNGCDIRTPSFAGMIQEDHINKMNSSFGRSLIVLTLVLVRWQIGGSI